ncbi:MAG TPA: hypothetical protein VI755_10110, partial [Anaerolineales bacterium]|nr:hypothetical protein [Anaerolineales bacterium]
SPHQAVIHVPAHGQRANKVGHRRQDRGQLALQIDHQSGLDRVQRAEKGRLRSIQWAAITGVKAIDAIRDREMLCDSAHPLAGAHVFGAAGGSSLLAYTPTSVQTPGKVGEPARRRIASTNGQYCHPFSGSSLFPDQPPTRESNVI